MGLRYCVPLPGPFYFSGRVGPKHWLPRSSSTGSGFFYFVMKWLIVYPSVAIFVAGLAIMIAPFCGLYWVIRRWERNRRKCGAVAWCFPIRRPVPALVYFSSPGAPRG